ncbi:MAG: ABC transporter ATP-binding protein [Deltaproteobacteria bacterium]|nr:ABC transporter ATP-binding protein [Deltaproteobacteria bacterium]
MTNQNSNGDLIGRISGGASNIRIKNLVKTFSKFVAVKDLSLDIKKGEFITLLGPSGSGKTTTLMMIAGFLYPNSGEIFVGNDSIVSKPAHKRNIGIVFQNYSLFPHMTISKNIAFPLEMRKFSAEDIEKRVNDALELVELHHLKNRYPIQLSGGQQQRVALARALVFRPPILLMDEPLGALDKNLRESMQLEIKEIQERLNITTVYVTHDQTEALTMSDRIVVMDKGQIEQIGTPEELYEQPSNRFVASFIGESNFLEGKICNTNEQSFEVKSEYGFNFHIAKDKQKEIEDTVCVAIRPENLFFVTQDSPPEGCSSAEGVIEEEIYLGEVRKYKVKIAQNQIFLVKVAKDDDSKAYKRKDKVRIGWKWSDCRIVE